MRRNGWRQTKITCEQEVLWALAHLMSISSDFLSTLSFLCQFFSFFMPVSELQSESTDCNPLTGIKAHLLGFLSGFHYPYIVSTCPHSGGEEWHWLWSCQWYHSVVSTSYFTKLFSKPLTSLVLNS